MLKFFRDQRGFTLVELMIVVVIVGILAAVAIPMYRGSTDRARASEAVATLGSIRSAMRVYFAEHDTYNSGSDFSDGDLVTVGDVLDVTDADLTGRYFSEECYTFHGLPDATTFSIEALGDSSTTSQKAEVTGITRYINQDGDITR